MAKLSISRIFEVSKLLATKSGKELQELVTYTSELAEQVLRILRNGVTLSDNIDCKVVTYSLLHNTPQEINTDGRTPVGLQVIRTISPTYGWSSVNWYLNDKGAVILTVGFTNSPASAVQTTLVIYYG